MIVSCITISYYSGSECVIPKRPFVDISYHPEWTRPLNVGVATFESWTSRF
jgi:hypothetical protein